MPAEPIHIIHGGAIVKIYPRKNGGWAINWRESGVRRSTTRSSIAGAEEFARLLARKLDAATGAQWVSPAQAETLQLLQTIPSPDGTFALLSQLRTALATLAGAASIDAAAAYYMASGPGTIQLVSFSEASKRFLAEYPPSSASAKTHRPALEAFAAAHPGILLIDIDGDQINANARRGKPAIQTVLNRLATWRTFFRRCKDWDLLPPGKKHPGELLKRPRLPSKSPPIFTIPQAKKLLELARAKKPRLLPFAIIAGWMGLRSSEIDRLKWSAWDWENSTLHLSTDVAQKLLQERFLPIPPEVAAALRPLMPENGRGKCCRLRDQKNLSLLYRAETGEDWPANGLRHSWFSYTLARTENIHQLAEWGGNSAAVIRRRYRRPVPAAAGAEWLQLLSSVLRL